MVEKGRVLEAPAAMDPRRVTDGKGNAEGVAQVRDTHVASGQGGAIAAADTDGGGDADNDDDDNLMMMHDHDCGDHVMMRMMMRIVMVMMASRLRRGRC